MSILRKSKFVILAKLSLLLVLSSSSYADFPTPTPSRAYPDSSSSQPQCREFRCTKEITIEVQCGTENRCWIEGGIELCADVALLCPKQECVKRECVSWE